MDIVALACGFAVPWILGAALILAFPPGNATPKRSGTLAWTLGCGWFAGAFLLTLWMRALSAAGVPFGVAAIGVPLAVVSGIRVLARLAPRPARPRAIRARRVARSRGR